MKLRLIPTNGGFDLFGDKRVLADQLVTDGIPEELPGWMMSFQEVPQAQIIAIDGKALAAAMMRRAAGWSPIG